MSRLFSARVLLPLAAIVAVALAVVERMALTERAAERRALLARNAELTARALMPGSALACLDGGAGDTVESACERAVFADAQSAAGAVAYMGARLSLLWDAHDLAEAGGDDLDDALAGTRRAIALDRFGIAAHVLAERDGCTAEACDAFALLDDAATLKANMKLRVFEQYVGRHAVRWNAPPAEKQPPAMSEAPLPPPPATAAIEPAAGSRPLAKQWDFPSAASIPPVSIMTTEPPRPKEGTEAQASQPPAEGDSVPVPPKRPQAQAPSPAQAR